MNDPRTCRDCGAEYVLTPKKPGLIQLCFSCSEDVPLLVAEETGSDDGVVDGVTDNPFTHMYLRERLANTGKLAFQPTDRKY